MEEKKIILALQSKVLFPVLVFYMCFPSWVGPFNQYPTHSIQLDLSYSPREPIVSCLHTMMQRGWCSDQFAHTSFAHRWLWRSQERAEDGDTVNTCSFDGFTALYWTTSLGTRMQGAERRRLAAERYSLSTIWVLREGKGWNCEIWIRQSK